MEVFLCKLSSKNLLIIIFLPMDLSKQQHEIIAKKMANGVVDAIGKQIENESLIFGVQSITVAQLIEKKCHCVVAKSIYHKEAKPLLDQLNQIKLSKQIELRQIERKADILKKSTVLENSRISKSKDYKKFQPSEFTQEEMQQIKAIIKKQQVFERKLKQKEKELQKWVLEQQKSQSQQRKQQLLEKCQQRKRQLINLRQELQKKQLKRQVQMREQIQKIKKIKEKQKLYQKMEEEWNKKFKAKQQEKIQNWSLQKQKKLINSTQIDDHEKKYIALKKEKSVQRQKTVEQVLSKSKLNLPFGRSKFLQSIIKEQEELALFEEYRKTEKENNVAVKKIYSKQVKEIFFPKIKLGTKEAEGQDKSMSIPLKKPLQFDQYYKLGNDYMRQAHQKVTKAQIQKDKKSLQLPNENGGYSAYYKNYLKEMQGQGFKQHLKREYTVRDFQKTLNNPQLSSADKLTKINKMMEFKQKKKKKNDTQLIDAIKVKMTILKELIR